MPSPAATFIAWAVRNRARLPRIIQRLPEAVESDPDGLLSRLAYRVLGGDSKIPPPTPAPAGSPRVLIGPANHAGQGTLWARALEAHVPRSGARSLAVTIPGGHSFPADSTVPLPIYRHSTRWQTAQRNAVVSGFDHILIESMRPVFGGLYASVQDEFDALREAGMSLAMIAHGTDVRSPHSHAARHRWSPFPDDPRTERLERAAERNRAFAESAGVPVFVSTPDLLDDLPHATWCPVVVDPTKWRAPAAPFEHDHTPVVVHVPSSAAVKGTQLVEPVLRRLDEQGLVDYRRLEAVPADLMPQMLSQADVVLDQFRIGSYGVAACEAMAAGRVVVSHVSDRVREHVRQETGSPVPIMEADPDSLEDVLARIVADPAAARETAARGPGFIEAVHAGGRSAEALTRAWLDNDRTTS